MQIDEARVKELCSELAAELIKGGAGKGSLTFSEINVVGPRSVRPMRLSIAEDGRFTGPVINWLVDAGTYQEVTKDELVKQLEGK